MSARAPDIRLIVPAGTGFAPETVGRAIILTSPLPARSGLTANLLAKNKNRAESSRDGTPRGTTLVPAPDGVVPGGAHPRSRWVPAGATRRTCCAPSAPPARRGEFAALPSDQHPRQRARIGAGDALPL